MPDMFDDEEEYFKKISKIKEQIRAERAQESKKLASMTEEETLEYEMKQIEEINKLAQESGQKTVFIDNDPDDK